jgi:hypothetical protein
MRLFGSWDGKDSPLKMGVQKLHWLCVVLPQNLREFKSPHHQITK